MSSVHIDVILNEVKDLVPVYPVETLHCVQHYAREICELNYDAVYNMHLYIRYIRSIRCELS